ncbi:MAG: hypothetical protein PHX08_06690 [Lachnospiraceae bacterium]|nr:hypothetical protein [Lachnospiraceae bacterium]
MNRILLIMLAMVLFIGVAPLQAKAETTNTASDLYYDVDRDAYIFRTRDKLKSSSTYYRTIGFTISRCQMGVQHPTEPDEYIVVAVRDFDATEGMVLDTYEDGNYVVTTWSISKSYVYALIEKEHPEWADELYNTYNIQTWLKFDALMIIYKNNVEQGRLINHKPYGTVYGNVDGLGVFFPEDMKNDMRKLSFSTASLNSVDLHFNKYLPYSLLLELDEPEYKEDAILAPKSEYIETIGKAQPDYYTWNSSDEFDIAKGIPSSEKVTNHVLIDEFYGTADIGLHREPKKWIFGSTIRWYTISYTYGKNGKKQHKNWHEESYHPVVQREAWYYYLQSADFYVYDRTDVKNGAFPNGQINYINQHPVTINFKVNGELNPEHVTSWVPKNSGTGSHVEWYDNYSSELGICDGGNSKNSAKRIANQRANEVICNLKWWGKSWNDLLSINGKNYLDDEIIYHSGNQ